jgi:hypothetical protein
MITSGSPKEPENEQQAAGHSQSFDPPLQIAYASSVSAWRSRKVIAFVMACCCASCDKSSGAVEVPNISPWGA